MRKTKVNLHMEQKRALLMMLFFALAFSLVSIFAGMSTRTEFAKLNSLLCSDYEYSVLTNEPVFQDDYYHFNAGVSFMLSADAKKSINADIIMQSAESNYTGLVDWNSGSLDMFGVAISEGIARLEGLKVGDIIYSKHIVDGLIHEYTVQKILHELTSVRESRQQSFYDGIIVMGYDNKYVDGISNEVIVFTKEPIQQIDSRVSGTPADIVYRTDEISFTLQRLLPYVLVFMIMAVLLTIGLVFMVTRAIKYNFKRLITIGFEKLSLDKSYRNLIYKIGFTCILIAFVIAMTVSQLFVFCYAEAVFLTVIVFAEMLGLIASAFSYRRWLWR